MQKQLTLTVLFVLMMTLVAPAPQVQATAFQQAQRRSPPVSFSRLRGTLVTADFERLIDGCLDNTVLVIVGDLTFQGKPSAPTNAPARVSVILSSRNLCTGDWPIYATGSAPLPEGSSPANPQLTTAHVQTPVVVTDDYFGNSYTLAVDLTWSGVGDLIRSQDHTQSHASGCTTVFRHFDTYRSAAITGNISSADINFASSDLIFAQLHSLKQGSITVGCG